MWRLENSDNGSRNFYLELKKEAKCMCSIYTNLNYFYSIYHLSIYISGPITFWKHNDEAVK